MNFLKLVLVGILITGTTQLKAQDYAFKVLVNKGKNEVKTGNNWQAIKVGSSLKPKDEIKVSESAYIGLAHVTGKTLEVKKAGKYKVEDLAAMLSPGTSVLNKYTDFILSANSDKKNKQLATGAVSRGDEIELYLPASSNTPAAIYNDRIMISWDATKIPGPYIVKLSSMFDDELFKLEAKENVVSLDLSDVTFANEDNILIEIASKTDKQKISKKYTLKRLSKADKTRIKTALSEIQPFVQEETAMNKLVLAGFYEKNNLLTDAGTQYLEAIKLAPDVPSFKEDYENFLLRTELKKIKQK